MEVYGRMLHPTEDEVACICRIKAMFKQPVQQVHEGFKDLDIGCPHLHRTLPPTVYSSDCDDNKERVRPVHDGDADDGDHWIGHHFHVHQWAVVVASCK